MTMHVPPFSSNPFQEGDWAILKPIKPFPVLWLVADNQTKAKIDHQWQSTQLLISLHQLSVPQLNSQNFRLVTDSDELVMTVSRLALIQSVFDHRMAALRLSQERPLVDDSAAVHMRNCLQMPLQKIATTSAHAVALQGELLQYNLYSAPKILKSDESDHTTYQHFFESDEFRQRDWTWRSVDDTEMRVHSPILLRFGSNRLTDDLNIPLESNILRDLIQYFYKGELDISKYSPQQMLTLYQFASEYKIEKVVEFLKPHVDCYRCNIAKTDWEARTLQRGCDALAGEPGLATVAEHYMRYVQEVGRETLTFIAPEQVQPEPPAEETRVWLDEYYAL